MADIELSNQPESHSPPASPTSSGGTVEATASDVAVDVGSSGTEEPKKPKTGKKGKKGGKKKGGGKPKVSAAAKETFNTLTEDLATILGRLRVASVVTAFIHALVTVLLFVMGYTPEGTSPSSTNQLPGTGVKNHASPTVVVTAFGALTTCVFAFTSVWNTFHNTTKATITTRRYHTGAFMAAVIRGFFLIFFLWPGLVVFMLHSYGSNFWGSIGEVKGDRAALIAADIVVCVATAVVDVVAFSVATSRLLSFKEVDAEEEEVKDKKEAQVEGKEPVLPTQEEEERKPLGKTELGIPFLTVGLSVVLVIVLCFVAVETGFNSGTLMSVGVHLLLLLVFGYLYYKVRAGNEDNSYTKATVVRYRVFLMVHLTAVVAVFWVTFSIMLLADGGATVQDKPINKSFFETVFGIGAERTVLCIIVLLCFFGAMITYGFILFYHQRALSILDEIASLNIMERTGRGTSQVSP